MIAAPRLRTLRGAVAIGLAAAAGIAAAHDTWFRLLRAAPSGEVLLLLGTGNRYPVQEFGVSPEHLRASSCRGGEAAALEAVQTTPKALLLRALPRPPLGCWVQLAPFDIELDPELVRIYLDEIEAPDAVRDAWAAMQTRGVRWKERYTKHARIEIGATQPAPAGLGLDVLLESAAPARAGDELVFRVLRDGEPLAGFAVELVAERGGAGQWLKTDAAGRVRARLATAGAWLLRGTAVRPSPSQPDAWESRFVTLAFEVGEGR